MPAEGRGQSPIRGYRLAILYFPIMVCN